MTDENIQENSSESERCDSRETWIKVIGKLGRETQLHLDERYRSFQITDYIIHAVSILLAIIAIFNVYYVTVLYQNLNGIVENMESMHKHLQTIGYSSCSIGWSGSTCGIFRQKLVDVLDLLLSFKNSLGTADECRL